MYTVLITIFIIAICGIVLDIIEPEEDDDDDVWKWMWGIIMILLNILITIVFIISGFALAKAIIEAEEGDY